MWRCAGPIRLDVGDEADESSVAFEDHVKLSELVALHPVGAFRIDLIPIHVTFNTLNHRWRALKVAQPIVCVCRAQRSGVLINERLKDALDVGLNRSSIRSAIILPGGGGYASRQRSEESGTKHE